MNEIKKYTAENTACRKIKSKEKRRNNRKQPAHKTIEIEKYVITSIPEDIKLIREGLQRWLKKQSSSEH